MHISTLLPLILLIPAVFSRFLPERYLHFGGSLYRRDANKYPPAVFDDHVLSTRSLHKRSLFSLRTRSPAGGAPLRSKSLPAPSPNPQSHSPPLPIRGNSPPPPAGAQSSVRVPMPVPVPVPVPQGPLVGSLVLEHQLNKATAGKLDAATAMANGEEYGEMGAKEVTASLHAQTRGDIRQETAHLAATEAAWKQSHNYFKQANSLIDGVHQDLESVETLRRGGVKRLT